MKLKKFIVWSFCAGQDEVFPDVVNATSEKHATKKIMRKRGKYAVLCCACPVMLLTDYIANLQAEVSK